MRHTGRAAGAIRPVHPLVRNLRTLLRAGCREQGFRFRSVRFFSGSPIFCCLHSPDGSITDRSRMNITIRSGMSCSVFISGKAGQMGSEVTRSRNPGAMRNPENDIRRCFFQNIVKAKRGGSASHALPTVWRAVRSSLVVASREKRTRFVSHLSVR